MKKILLTLRVLELQGPTNTRKYIVGVYFRGERLATGSGGSIRQAEMDAANNALKEKSGQNYVLY